MISVVLALVLTSPTSSLERAAVEAFDAGDYRSAAATWGQLARQQTNLEDREVAVYTAAQTWARVDVCEGLALLKWWFTEGQPVDPEFIVQYRNLRTQQQEAGLDCDARRAPSVSHRPAVVRQPVTEPPPTPSRRIRLPEAYTPTQRDDRPKSHDPLKLAGGLLLGTAGVGAGVLVGQGVEFARVFQEYAQGPTHDEKLYQQAKTLERWMLGTGVATAATLAAGVASLAVARHRQLKLQPTLGGITLRGRF